MPDLKLQLDDDADDEGSVEIDIGSVTITGRPNKLPKTLPVLPIRGAVMFPGTVVPVGVAREGSLKLLNDWLPKSKLIAMFTQRDEDMEKPGAEDLYEIGTVAMVLKLVKQDEGVTLVVHGVQRARRKKVVSSKPYLTVELEPLGGKSGRGKTFKAEVNQLRDEARELVSLSPNAPEQAENVLLNLDDPSNLADFLAANLALEVEQRQELLEELDVPARVRKVHKHVASQLELARLQQKIAEDVHGSIGEMQRKHFLREQVRAIQRELGEDEGAAETVQSLRDRLEAADPPEPVMQEAVRELTRLESIPPASPEYSVILNYVELIADLPWAVTTEDNLDLERAQSILDRDHFDLDKVKRRLIEYLAVRQLNPQGRGAILCLVGPPGVGKTSLGESVAQAMGRKFSRMSFGGIRDEAEIRGHRRTYIGAMPGRIIQELRRAGTQNPVMMLDELDKLGSDYRGDPASALLEALDPKQNHAFVDRYLDVPFDLSRVLFICTANYIDGVPHALRDRLEVIEVPGYTDHDKLQIARKYLVPRQLKEHGLKRAQCSFRASGIRKLIDAYTREAGVRELERQVGSVCRGTAAKVARKKTKPARQHFKQVVDDAYVRELLGPEKFTRELDERTQIPGVVVGLAYTSVGGEILYIEAASYPGKGGLQLTGHVGDVMKESAQAALTLFKGRAEALRFDVARLAERDLHIHVPAGAVPKDGPSAGVAMYTAIASLLLNRPVKARLAMTGEITLRGRVMAVGGIKEKTLAAHRAGIKTILLPADNERDMEEIDANVRRACRFQFMKTVDDVLDAALSGRKRK